MQNKDLTSPTSGEVSTAAGLYAKYEQERWSFLDRARECARYTIPSIMPEEGFNSQTKLYTPYQSVGSRGVNNLSSKLLLALFPPNSPFFRLKINESELTNLSEGDAELKVEIEEALSKMEKTVMEEIETSGDRVVAFEMLKHLIVCGNVLLYVSKDGLKLYHLDHYVVRRDPMGNVLEIITKETIDHRLLPEGVQEIIQGVSQSNYAEKNCDIYTHVYLEGKTWKEYQEVKGVKIPDSEGSYPLEKSPYIPLRYTRIDGQDYGRSFVEEYLGDMKTLEFLTKAIVKGAAAAAKLLIMVNPNGTTSKKAIRDSDDGDIIDGIADEVSFLQADKYYDFRTPQEVITSITERLSYAFMLNSAIQRNGDRVTAEEIRFMAGELEDTLGGTYSLLSIELQLPYTNLKLDQLAKKGQLPKLPKGIVKPSIITGMEALGRGHDLNKIRLANQILQETFGPEGAMQILNGTAIANIIFTSLGLDAKTLTKSPEQLAQEQQQSQMMAMMQQLGPQAINQIGGITQKSMEQQNGQGQTAA